MNKDRKISWESIIIYCFTFGGITGAATIFLLLTGCAAGNEILKNTGICLSVVSGMGSVAGVISAIVNSRTAKKKEINSSPEIENSSEELEEGHGENDSLIQPAYESDDAREASDAGGTTEGNDKEMSSEYIRSVDSNISGYEDRDSDSESDSGTATDGKTVSEADMAKKEYMVEIYEESFKNIKVIAKDSREAVELAKEIYRNESPIVSDKAVKTTVGFIAKPFIVGSDSEHEFFIGKKEGGKIII